jgi:prophage antirepressor-like protein
VVAGARGQSGGADFGSTVAATRAVTVSHIPRDDSMRVLKKERQRNRRLTEERSREQDIIDFMESMCYYLLVRPADRMLLVI